MGPYSRINKRDDPAIRSFHNVHQHHSKKLFIHITTSYDIAYYEKERSVHHPIHNLNSDYAVCFGARRMEINSRYLHTQFNVYALYGRITAILDAHCISRVVYASTLINA